MYSAYKLNKHGDNTQPQCTPFPILNQFIVPCPVLTFASESVTGRKAIGPQVAGGNKLQVADNFFFLLCTKLKEASFNSVLMTRGSALS